MNIEDLIANAGDLKSPPVQKVPKKWFPESISILIRLIILPFVLLDLAAQKIARMIIRPPFKKVGKCKKRGNCCYYILVRRSKGVLGWIDLLWHTQINGFYRRTKETYRVDGKSYYLMGCRYLKQNGSCSRYLIRPAICRIWPRIEYFGRPEMLKGCGYTAKVRKGSNIKLPILD